MIKQVPGTYPRSICSVGLGHMVERCSRQRSFVIGTNHESNKYAWRELDWLLPLSPRSLVPYVIRLPCLLPTPIGSLRGSVGCQGSEIRSSVLPAYRRPIIASGITDPKSSCRGFSTGKLDHPTPQPFGRIVSRVEPLSADPSLATTVADSYDSYEARVCCLADVNIASRRSSQLIAAENRSSASPDPIQKAPTRR